MVKMKRCTKCGEEKEVTAEHFGREKKNKDGYSGMCRPCRRLRDNQLYQENKEVVKQRYEANKEAKKQYYQKNKDAICARQKEYRGANKELINKQNKKYYEDNKSKINKRSREWGGRNKEAIAKKDKLYREKNKEYIFIKKKHYREENPEKFRIFRQSRRTKQKSLPATLTNEQWQFIREHFNETCAYCGTQDVKLTIEHFIPVSRLGELTINNVLPVCSSCNSSKGNKLFAEWYPRQKFFSEKREKLLLSYLGYKNNVQQLAFI